MELFRKEIELDRRGRWNCREKTGDMEMEKGEAMELKRGERREDEICNYKVGGKEMRERRWGGVAVERRDAIGEGRDGNGELSRNWMREK